jgi:MFS family permease
MYLGTPLALVICRLYPRWARWCTLAGVSAASLSLAASSLCNSVPRLIVAQGIGFGISSCFAYCPSTLYINEWFVLRKGLAYGIVWSAAGFGGVVLPLILETLLNSYGFQTATRIWAAILFAFSVPMAYFVKPRMSILASPPTTPFSMRFVTSKPFITHQVINFIQATGFFLPGIYLPTYARMAFGASTFLSALTVILLNLASAIGLVIMGLLSDRLAVSTCMIISAAGAATSVLVIWGLAPSLPVLYLFCVLYGLFAGSWPSIWPGIMKQVSQNGDTGGYGNVDPVMVQGQLCVSRGIGNIASGPLSNWLIKDMPWKGQAVAGYGSGYGLLILYTGITALLSGINLLFKPPC